MIYKAKEEDLEAILSLNQKFVPKVGSVDLAFFKTMFKMSECFLVAQEGDKLVGFLLALKPKSEYKSENYRWFENKYDSHLYVDRIAIGNEFHGKGYGKNLYNYLVEFAMAKYERITCEVNIRPSNEPSLKFHLGQGFKEVGQLETKAGEIRVAMLSKDLSR